MTRKHFNAFAKRISRIEDSDKRLKVAMVVADVCYEFNHRFDWCTFRKACGLDKDESAR
jgi:hypothetical protein